MIFPILSRNILIIRLDKFIIKLDLLSLFRLNICSKKRTKGMIYDVEYIIYNFSYTETKMAQSVTKLVILAFDSVFIQLLAT